MVVKTGILVAILSGILCFVSLNLLPNSLDAAKVTSDREEAHREAVQDVNHKKSEFKAKYKDLSNELNLEMKTYKAAKKEYREILTNAEALKKLSYKDFADDRARSSGVKNSGKSFFNTAYLYEAIQKDLLPTEDHIKESVAYRQKEYQSDAEIKDFVDTIVFYSDFSREDYWDIIVYVQEVKTQLSVNLSNGYLLEQGKEPRYGQGHHATTTKIASEEYHNTDQDVANGLTMMIKDAYEESLGGKRWDEG